MLRIHCRSSATRWGEQRSFQPVVTKKPVNDAKTAVRECEDWMNHMATKANNSGDVHTGQKRERELPEEGELKEAHQRMERRTMRQPNPPSIIATSLTAHWYAWCFYRWLTGFSPYLLPLHRKNYVYTQPNCNISPAGVYMWRSIWSSVQSPKHLYKRDSSIEVHQGPHKRSSRGPELFVCSY